jgi:hypothetical protein
MSRDAHDCWLPVWHRTDCHFSFPTGFADCRFGMTNGNSELLPKWQQLTDFIVRASCRLASEFRRTADGDLVCEVQRLSHQFPISIWSPREE